MKSIEAGLNKRASARFHTNFYLTFSEDLEELGKLRGMKVTGTHLNGTLCSIIDLINECQVSYQGKTRMSAKFARITLEITEHKSAKFMITLLDKDKNLVSEKSHTAVFYFLATEEDLKTASNSLYDVKRFEMPGETPPLN